MDKLLKNGWTLQQKSHMMVLLKYSRILIMQAKLKLIMPYEEEFLHKLQSFKSVVKVNFIFVYLAKKALNYVIYCQSHEQQGIYRLVFLPLQGKREHHYLHISDTGVRNPFSFYWWLKQSEMNGNIHLLLCRLFKTFNI